MKTLHTTLSFAQMLVRSQWRHDARNGPVRLPPPERRCPANAAKTTAETPQRRQLDTPVAA